MKLSAVGLVATFAVATQGFSVTMSSLGYLDKMSSAGAQLSSFADTGSSYSYSASYSAPAPAPASYTSPLADAPANNDLHYIKTLGGGNAMKSGPNYSGVSRSFRSTEQNSLYSAPPAAAYSANVVPEPSYSNGFTAPGSNDIDYMKSLGGGNAMKSGQNYSGVSRSFRLGDQTSSFSAPAPAPYNAFNDVQPSYANGATAPANNDLNYIKSLGGGSAMKSGPNYAGVSRSFQKTASSSVYTPPVAEPAQQSYSASSTTVSSDLNYIKSLGGGSTMKSGPNYSGVSRSFQKTASSSVYTPPAAEPAQQSYSASVPASTDLNYIKSLDGGSAMKSGPNYSGVSRSFQKTASSSVYTPHAVEPAQQSYSVDASVPASTDLNYIKSLGGGSAMKSGPNYMGVSRSFQKTASSSVYTPPAAEPSQQSYSASVPASTDLNYIKSLGGGSAMKSGPNYSGVSRSFEKTASSSVYTPPSAEPAQQSYSASVPASTDLNYIKSLGGGSAMKSGPNYSGVSRSFQKTTPSNVYTPPAVESVQQSYSVDASVPSNTDLNYIKSLGGGNAMKSGPNYMGVSQSFQRTTPANVYTPPLPAAAPVEQSYNTASSFQSNSDINYIKSIGGGNSMKSGPNYSGVSRSFTATTTQGSLYSAPASSSYSSEQSSYTANAGATANNDLQYIKSLGGGNAMKSGNNYSGVSSTFRPTGNGSQYMEALKQKSMAPASYSTSTSYSYNSYVENDVYGAPVPAPSNGSYLDSNGPVSSSYGSMNNSFAKATKNYMGVNPRPRATQSAFGSYVEKL